MNKEYQILIIIFIHWIADFILQTDEMAKNKSTSNYWLAKHVLLYSNVWLLIGWFISFPVWSLNVEYITIDNVWKFALITFVCHFITDYFTSRLNAKLWKEEKRHEFFIAIGGDQVLHYIQLILTFYYLTGK